ncbi:efflux transporter outer membrane subunit [Chitinophagaceae bacterium 26-R-25]|nr:efflux transporter outer membrane subunit [Chitinophagaceae bacterium 26-R-25]
MKTKHAYLFLAVILLSVSCMVGKKYQKPTAPANISYRDSLATDTMPLAKWFDVYKDSALAAMIKTTLDSNRDLLTAAARVEEARTQTAVVKANALPQFGYSAQAGGGHAGSSAKEIAAGIEGGLINAFGVLNWELDIWGKLRHNTRSFQAQFLASVNNRNALQVSLVSEVATDYFLLRDLDNRLYIAQQTLENRKERTNIISQRFDKGYVPELDKLQAQQQEAIAAATIPSIQRAIVQTENAIRLLMGQGPGRVSRGYSNFDQTLSPDIPVGLPSQLLERRPDIIAAEKNLEAQFEQIGVAQANRFPTISLTGILGFASPQLSSFIDAKGFVANGFGNITGPIFQFNQRKNLVEVEKRRTEQVSYQYQQTVLAAFGDVDNALNNYKTFSEEYEQRRFQVEVASKALTLSKARYDFGYTSYIEVILMENNLFDAQLDASQALQGKLNSIVLLYKSLGGGW